MNYLHFSVFKILFLLPIAIILLGSLSVYGTPATQAISENGRMETNFVNISSPAHNQNVTIGNLTIAGTSSDNESSNCNCVRGLE